MNIIFLLLLLLVLQGGMAGKTSIYMRLRVMTTKERHEDVNQSIWLLPNHTATDVLQIIRDIKPNLLERFVPVAAFALARSTPKH